MTHRIRGKNREASVSFPAEAAEAPLAFSILREIHVREGQSEKGSSAPFLGAPRIPENPLDIPGWPLWSFGEFSSLLGASDDKSTAELHPVLTALFGKKKRKKRKKCLWKAISEVIKISPRVTKHFPSHAFPSASTPRKNTTGWICSCSRVPQNNLFSQVWASCLY